MAERARHKYIKKVWHNGKWQYYYYDKNGNRNTIKSLSALSDFVGEDDRTRRDIARSKMLATTHSKTPFTAKLKTDTIRMNYKNVEQLAPNGDKRWSELKKLNSQYARYNSSVESYVKANKAYSKTILGLSEKIIHRGKEFVDI